ncbi:MAG: excinuclease ABC subunit UvrA [Candidatus Egerieousia sp.]|nr:excinuclease ABC subunit UvrA [Candidatus Egerieousia sp.]
MNQKSGATDKKSGAIVIKGARANNLKGIDVTIPRGKLVVITGVSGSGKSSLAFDTLFAEGQRRFAESLSSFARQFLGRMSKPAAESITGIPPAIAIEQKVTSKNPRSTVGTVTECYDYLRLLYAKIGRTYSPVSGVEVKCESVKDVVEYLCSRITAKVLYLTADTGLNTPDARIERLLNLRQAGYSRVLALPAAQKCIGSTNSPAAQKSASGTGSTAAQSASNLLVARIDEILRQPEQWQQHSLYALIDRYLPQQQGTLSADLLSRMQDSAKSAFELGEGRLQVVESGSQSADSETPLLREFSNRFEADGILFEEPSEQMFSYNSPVGACPRCGGFGSIEGIDEGLVIPNASLSIYEGAIACWRGEVMSHFKDELVMNAQRYNISIHKPYLLLSKEEKRLIWEGTEHFTGIAPFFKMVEKQRYKIQYKYMLSRYQGRTVCPECEGSRLKRETKYVKISGRDISQLMNMSISSLLEFLDSLHLEPYEMEVAGLALKELKQRLNCICQVGLGYLTLNRGIKGLSGGESQRIHLVSAIGSSLVGSLYILDEPSIGLHPRDTLQLIGVLKRLRDLGNTVVIVEHDLEIIRNADYLIDIGPLAGQHGGEVVFQGDIATALSTKEYGKSLTLRYLQGVERLNSALLPALHSAHPVRSWRNCIELKGCMEHNLKDIDVKIPLGVLTVITGVSGSGKSSLVSDILYPALSRHFNIVGDKPGAFRELGGDLKLLSGVEYVDQNPIGKSSRSNPVTYLKIYDDIRRLFSEQPYAKLNNYTPSSFSFNIDGGRCPQCLGDGYITIPMQFMADVTMVCEECGGKRFKSDLLEVRYQGKNISDVLDMSVSEAIEFFSHREEAIAQRIARSLQILERVGLGYLKLGQSSSTLSGGESQRVKLAQFLSKENGTGGTLFIFDEPTTGLHLHDIKNLINSINALIERGNSVVVVEHNVEVMRSADWIIDMGPDGGDQGGRVVFAGKVADLAKLPDNYTAAALASQQ